MKDLIKIYPVGNGDHSLIILRDGTTITVDCNIRQNSIGSADSKIYDVKKEAAFSDNLFYLLTHPRTKKYRMTIFH